MIHDKLRELGIGFMGEPEPFERNRPVLVMIHGAGGNSGVWQSQASPLSGTVNTLALDLPGHGNTPGPGREEIREYADWAIHVLESVLEEPVFLMGHSMGGAIVLDVARLRPEIAKGIILSSTGPRLKVAPAFLEGLRDRFDETVDQMMQFAYAPEADPGLVREGASWLKEAGAQTVLGDFLACDRFDRRKDIGGIRLPCLILCGDLDKLTCPVKVPLRIYPRKHAGNDPGCRPHGHGGNSPCLQSIGARIPPGNRAVGSALAPRLPAADRRGNGYIRMVEIENVPAGLGG